VNRIEAGPAHCRRAPLAAFAMVAALWLACAQAAIAHVTVTDPWVRGTVEGQTASGAYMTLESDTAVRLTVVTSPLAARCSVHEMTMSANVMRMRALDSLPLAAGEKVQMGERSGKHVMLEGLVRPLRAGDMVPLKLTFVDANGQRQILQVQAPVRPLGAP